MDPQVLVQYCLEGNADKLLHALQSELQLQRNAFKDLQLVLSGVLFSKVDHAASLSIILRCLVQLCESQQTVDWSPALPHLLLEQVPSQILPSTTTSFHEVALPLFVRFCTVENARLALKIATTYNLPWDGLDESVLMVTFVQQLFTNKANMTPAVGLVMHFKEMQQQLDCHAMVQELVAAGQESLAEKWTASMSQEYQVTYIEQCMAYGRWKAAAKAVRSFQLTSRFPNVENLYREHTLGRLMEKRLWPVAATFVGIDKHLQVLLVKHLAAEGESTLALEYLAQWGLEESVAHIDPEALAAEETRRAQVYLGLDVPEGHVVFVDSGPTLEQAAAELHSASVVGLDVEWKPFTEANSGSAPASILQVASEDKIFIFDLLHLNQDPTLDSCLQRLFSSPGVMKLGLELGGDLRKLSASYPHLQAFQEAVCVVDVRDVWIGCAKDKGFKGQAGTLGSSMRGLGLSKLAQQLLGRPLDKSMQVSNWEARPLSARQLRYAALDAHVLLLIHRRLLELSPTAKELFHSAATHFKSTGRPPTAKKQRIR